MILPIAFLWKQLNGPQITGIVKAIFQFIKNKLDTHLDYYNNISIDTADEKHLELIGTLMGISRPIFTLADEKFFWFTTNDTEAPYEHGYGTAGNKTLGGKFSDINKAYETMKMYKVALPVYRELLKAVANSRGEEGSLIFLDDVTYAMTQKMSGSDIQAYNITISSNSEELLSGQIDVDIGPSSQYNQPEQLYKSLDTLYKTLLGPDPRIVLHMQQSV